MKATRRAGALLLVLSMLACSQPSSQKQVENGLLPLAPVKGWPAWSLEERLRVYGVPGVSIAVFDNFELVWAAGYGTAAASEPVRPETLFQVGNLSMLVTAAGALEQVEAGKLALDAPVASALRSWQLPIVDPAAPPVTLRQLLSNTAGISIEQLPGYYPDDPLPTLAQMLTGELPTNTPPVRPLRRPGQQHPPSAGGYLIVQQLLEEASGQPFAELARASVLEPLGMSASSFEQPLSAARLAGAASGHLASGQPIAGKAKVYPELAAAGLWTTASDYAKLLLEIAKASARGGGQVLGAEQARELAKPVAGAAALGVLISEQGGTPRLINAGQTEGFFGRFVVYTERGTGAVVLSNSENGRALVLEIFQAIARAHDWPAFMREESVPIQVAADRLDQLAGRYGVGLDGVLEVRREGDHLEMRELYGPAGPVWIQLAPIAENAFSNVSNGQVVGFEVDRRGRGTAFTFQGANGQELKWARLDDGAPPRAHELLEAGKIEEAIAAYRALEQISEQRMNLTGYALMRHGKLDAAAAVLELNAERYPDSANAFDSLADVYLLRNEPDKALAAVQKAKQNLEHDTTTELILRQVLIGKVDYLLRRLGG